jgi:hypothetical protein
MRSQRRLLGIEPKLIGVKGMRTGEAFVVSSDMSPVKP